MKTRLKKLPLLVLVTALVFPAVSLVATAADQPVNLPAYEVTAPRFSSPFAAFIDKLNTMFDEPWIDARGSPLIQAIIWRHGYLVEHPSDEALIYINRGPDGQVSQATTIYTQNGALYANSYALGEHVRLHGLTAADIHQQKKVEDAIDGIREAYELDASLELAVFRGLGDLAFSAGQGRGGIGYYQSNFLPVSGEFTAGGGGYNPFNPYLDTLYTSPGGLGDTGQIVPSGLNFAYPGFLDPSGGTGDRHHEPPAQMLDTVYRALHDPGRAGLIPVAVSPVSYQVRTRKGIAARSIPAVVFDWEGVHYVYRPYSGTIGHPIPRNPVTGLPYLCVKDGGLIESIYFSATYLKAHPLEKSMPVASDDPFAAYTLNGKLCLFSPSLNHFVLLKGLAAGAIGDTAALQSSIAEARARLASHPPPAATAGITHPRRVPERLTGDTADSQMRRIFVAFQEAGIPVHLNSGETSSLTFSWQGVNYVYGSDQQLRPASRG